MIKYEDWMQLQEQMRSWQDERIPNFPGALRLSASTDSTNDEMKSWARDNAASGSVLIANTQNSGKGTGAKRWHSPPNLNIYMSLLYRNMPLEPQWSIRFGEAVKTALHTTLVSSIPDDESLRSTLSQQLRKTLLIKAPNDILFRKKKCCGILVESTSTGQILSENMPQADTLIVGIGVNIYTQKFATLPRGIATSLEDETRKLFELIRPPIDINHSMKLVLNNLKCRCMQSIILHCESLVSQYEESS